MRHEWIHASEKEYGIPENPDTLLFVDLDFIHHRREHVTLTTLLSRLDAISPPERHRVIVVGGRWTPPECRLLTARGVHYFKTALSGSDYVPTVEKLETYFADVVARSKI